MKRIWYFGDSNTEDYNTNYPWAKQYLEWKGYKPEHWTKLFAERLGLPYSNFGLGGSDNYTIFKSLSDNIEMIGDNDIVIIGWTTVIRGRIANMNSNEWFTITPICNPDFKYITTDAILQLVSIRDSPLYVHEVLDWQKVIKRAFKTNTLIFWSTFPEFLHRGIMDSRYWKGERGYLSINSETKGVINDEHFCEVGNVIIADAMWNYIDNPPSYINNSLV
jgi:hypothetical protein